MLAQVCICLGRNDINLFYPLDNIVKVPTVVGSSTELTSWEENVREGENHPSSNYCSLHITQHWWVPPPPSTSQSVSTEVKDIRVFKYEALMWIVFCPSYHKFCHYRHCYYCICNVQYASDSWLKKCNFKEFFFLPLW